MTRTRCSVKLYYFLFLDKIRTNGVPGPFIMRVNKTEIGLPGVFSAEDENKTQSPVS